MHRGGFSQRDLHLLESTGEYSKGKLSEFLVLINRQREDVKE